MSSLSISRLEEILSSAFIQLLDLSISTIRHDPDYPSGSPSYNVILTLEHLHLIPRKHETYTLRGTEDKISINSMGFAGMLLVRSEGELEAVKREGVAHILRSVALESVHDLQVETARAVMEM
jgi:ATP adenylyltransferase